MSSRPLSSPSSLPHRAGLEFVRGQRTSSRWTAREIPIEFAPFGECNGIVRIAHDCDDGTCRIRVDFEEFGLVMRGGCVFHHVEWNPWSDRLCRFRCPGRRTASPLRRVSSP